MKNHFFNASLSEKKGLLLVAYIMVLSILGCLFFLQDEVEMTHYDQEQFRHFEKQLAALQKTRKDTLFYFNPNTISREELKLLRVNPVAVQNWIEKREKYAFHKPGDVLWVKGLSKYEYLRLEKYMVFEEKGKTEFHKESRNYSSEFDKPKQAEQITSPEPYNLNTITESELEALKIRSFVAERLVKFRESLGGFYSKNQLKDIYGIKDFEIETLSSGYIKTNEIVAKNWSEQSFKELLSHPYVNYETCKRIFFLKDSLKARYFLELEGFLPKEDYSKLKAYYN